MSKTVIKNSKVLVRRVVGDVPFVIASCANDIRQLRDASELCLKILTDLSPLHRMPLSDVRALCDAMVCLCESYDKSVSVLERLTELHKTLNPEDLGLEVID